MVNDLIERIELQKYIYLLFLFVNKRLNADEFQDLFLRLRRTDNYWLSGGYSIKIGNLLDTFFLDVDEYTPEEEYLPNDAYMINFQIFKERASVLLKELLMFSELNISEYSSCD
jgi:hypothetical protein